MAPKTVIRRFRLSLVTAQELRFPRLSYKSLTAPAISSTRSSSSLCDHRIYIL